MKLSTLFHSLSVAVAFGFAATTPMHAETLLFEDAFVVENQVALDEPGGRQDINREAAQRQKGSLAPAEYSSNGQPWQQQLYTVGPHRGGALRIFPTRHEPLFLSPAWSLEESAGDYTLKLRVHPHQGDEEMPAMIFVALGTHSGPLFDGASNILAGSLVLKASLLLEPTIVLMQNGVEISDAAPFQGMPRGGDLEIKWTQTDGREITKVEVLIDGTSILKHEGAVVVRGGGMTFGGRMSPDQRPDDFGCLVIDSLRYTRE
jgi:hypothetical protein